MKRKRQPLESGAEDVVRAALTQALEAIAATVPGLEPAAFLPLRLHGVKARDLLPRDAATVGTTQYSSDLPIRLFHSKCFADAQAPAVVAEQVRAAAMAFWDRLPTAAEFVVVDVRVDPTTGRLVAFTRQVQPTIRDDVMLDASITVLHEDPAILVVDKPPNVLSVDGVDHPTSLFSLLQLKYPQVRMVHRLDFETSGVLVVALTREAAQHLNAQFRLKTVRKTYHALVHGVFDPPSGSISAPIGPDPTHRVRQRIDVAHGKASETSYAQLSTAGETSFVELQPVTGRTHQLRVHLHSLGCPIVGDSLYYLGPEAAKAISRLHLHASSLTVQHPTTGLAMTFESPCPFRPTTDKPLTSPPAAASGELDCASVY
ncbi:Pseudouridylate synthase [Achlya hypogyna]|uniref:Pseudouridine synthase n=1 Tax=Achlya hypogyna TaxID=1202772 RepID=A0A1V9ZE69_ACHHY|nr:Pseudouridylate synthase [Achlya hypogyna]